MRAPLLFGLSLLIDKGAFGVNSCLSLVGGACSPGTTYLSIADCTLTDDDLDDLRACFENAGEQNVTGMDVSSNRFTTLSSGVFEGMTSLEEININSNSISSLPEDVFNGLSALEELNFDYNELSSLPTNIFAGLSSLKILLLWGNRITYLPTDLFEDLSSLETLDLGSNLLTTLPAWTFTALSSLEYLRLGNDGLQCVPNNTASDASSSYATSGMCECSPVEVVVCSEVSDCAPGEMGYTCDADNDSFDTSAGKCVVTSPLWGVLAGLVAGLVTLT